MCGISGWFDLKGERSFAPALLQAMTDAIAHRGPDGDGFHQEPGLGFGHRRLSIIDVAGGAQPMFDALGSIVIVFNGEIYNYLALRAELEARGHIFRTRSDTEILIEGWRAWGPAMLDHLRGMFAFTLWDRVAQRLFMARDRMGEKPLYYAILPDNILLFGSELKALMVHPALARDVDPRAVDEFLALGYIPDPRTIYRSVLRLPAGHSLMIERGGEPVLRRYWNISRREPRAGDLDALADELLERFTESVRGQLMSEVPLGAFLSGGVDSSATVATIARITNKPVTAFTIGFRDPGYDETGFAAEVAAQYQARHVTRMMDGSETDLVRLLPRIYDEPFGDSSALPTLNLMRLAREQVTVALSGDAGDELFAGYRRYAFHAREEAIRQRLPATFRRALFGSLARAYPQLDAAPRWLRARHTFEELSFDTEEGFFSNVAITDDLQRKRLYSAEFKRQLGGFNALETIADTFADSPFDDAIATAQYVDLKTWLPGDILTKVDRASMACGLEVRVPMLDHDFVEWSVNLPRLMKLEGNCGKRVLKHAFARLLPAGFLDRPKRGFSVPLADWFRGTFGDRFQAQALSPGGVGWTGPFSAREIRLLIDEHRSGRRDHSRTLWLLWMYQGFINDVNVLPTLTFSSLEAS